MLGWKSDSDGVGLGTIEDDAEVEERTVSARFLAATSRFQSSRNRRSSSSPSVASMPRMSKSLDFGLGSNFFPFLPPASSGDAKVALRGWSLLVEVLCPV